MNTGNLRAPPAKAKSATVKHAAPVVAKAKPKRTRSVSFGATTEIDADCFAVWVQTHGVEDLFIDNLSQA